MKFIREIIGEKRQMDKPANGTPVSAPMDSVLADAILSSDDVEVEQAHPEAAPVAEEHIEEASAMEPAMEQVDAVETATSDHMSDALEAFFAEDGLGDLAASEPEVETSLPEPKPTRLVLGDTQSAPEPDPAPIDDVSEVEASQDAEIAEQVDKALVSDYEPDKTLEAVFRATKPEPEVAEGTVEADPQPAPMATEEPAPEPAQAAPEEVAETPQEAPARPSLFSQSAKPEPAPQPESQPVQNVEVPQPAVGRGTSRHGRVKTRLLGFNSAMDTGIDPISESEEATAATCTQFPVGWLIVVDGPGRGSAFTLFNGVSNIGRGEDQTVRLDFGDNSISRENHASVAYDPRQKSFFIGHGGKANIVRRNDRPVLSTEEMTAGDHITIGETTMRFVPFCGPDFAWEDTQETGPAYATRD